MEKSKEGGRAQQRAPPSKQENLAPLYSTVLANASYWMFSALVVVVVRAVIARRMRALALLSFSLIWGAQLGSVVALSACDKRPFIRFKFS